MRVIATGVLLGLALGGAGGCSHPERQRAADAYMKQANSSFAEDEERAAIFQAARAQHPEVSAIAQKAWRTQQTIVGAKFRGTAKYGRPSGMTKIWVTLVIGQSGRVESARCVAAAPAASLDASTEAFVLRTVQEWIFSPMTVDGAAVPSLNVFPAFTDGRELFVSEERELR